ncbi:acyl carrier protein [Streptomyces sp. NBC_00503]|uniref:acyl carrier protein n=1 Tax=Streptomyces sp. NBC_00503 TaxID=2903659 RepID=UPI002E80E886|nr:phosphopantetheine-binding protein [Streptomyces sp. NBC_00503]WUD79507.1 phosphopantetheine-binding protein [Streptomyces sp. NBC_00503]
MTTSAPESVMDLISEILVGTFEVPADEVTPDALMRDLLVDSLMVVEMAIAVHEALGVKVDEEELKDTTLARFAEVLEARRTSR